MFRLPLRQKRRDLTDQDTLGVPVWYVQVGPVCRTVGGVLTHDPCCCCKCLIVFSRKNWSQVHQLKLLLAVWDCWAFPLLQNIPSNWWGTSTRSIKELLHKLMRSRHKPSKQVRKSSGLLKKIQLELPGPHLSKRPHWQAWHEEQILTSIAETRNLPTWSELPTWKGEDKSQGKQPTCSFN